MCLSSLKGLFETEYQQDFCQFCKKKETNLRSFLILLFQFYASIITLIWHFLCVFLSPTEWKDNMVILLVRLLVFSLLVCSRDNKKL